MFDLQAFVLTLLSLSIAYLTKLFIRYVCFCRYILSWDQKYLNRMWIAIIVGKVDDDLAAIEPGPPCVSWWNTLWSRVLRVYVATAQPSNQLQRIANMVVKFSAPMWFQIKRHSNMTDGSHNTFVCLQLLKHLNDMEIKIVNEAIQRNAFFAYPDQLLFAMWHLSAAWSSG